MKKTSSIFAVVLLSICMTVFLMPMTAYANEEYPDITIDVPDGAEEGSPDTGGDSGTEDVRDTEAGSDPAKGGIEKDTGELDSPDPDIETPEPGESGGQMALLGTGPDYTLVLYGGEQYMNSINPANIIPGGVPGVSWDPALSAWTFENMSFETSARIAVIIEDECTLLIKGANTIKGGDSPADTTTGLIAYENITIGGDGALTVTAGDTTEGGEDYKDSLALAAYGDMDIQSGILTLVGGVSGNGRSYGLCVVGDANFEGGTVKATGGTGKAYSCGIYIEEGNVSISEATIEATAAESEISEGFTASEHFEIMGGSLIAKGGNASREASRGLNIYGNAYFTGGAVSATAGLSAVQANIGLRAGSNASFSGCTVTATGGTSSKSNSVGLFVAEEALFEGSTVTAAAGISDTADSVGLYIQGNVFFETSTVEATAGKALNGLSRGIYTNQTGSYTFITESNIKATGGDGKSSHGMYVYGNFYATDAELTVVSGDSTSSSMGIYAFNNATFSGCNAMIMAGDGRSSTGIYTRNNLEIQSGYLAAAGGTADGGKSCGIRSYNLGGAGSTLIGGGTVVAIGGDGKGSCGMEVDGDFRITDGGLTATSGDSDGEGADSYGLYANRADFPGGTVAVISGSSNMRDSIGIYVKEEALFRGGHVIAAGTVGSRLAAGIGSANGADIIISDGDVTFMGRTFASAEYGTAAGDFAPAAPRTKDMFAQASVQPDSSGAELVSTWMGDTSDDVSTYKYLRFFPITVLPQLPQEMSVPKTGDESNVILWFAMMVAAGCGAAAIARRRRSSL